MHFDAKTFLDKAVGDDFLETLSKSDLYKPNANAVVDLEDIRIGLKVVPRVIMSMLIRELPPMKLGESKAIPLMVGQNAILNVNKHDPDTYSGSLISDGKVLSNFKFRPLPGVGLIIMSAFELYEMEEIPTPTPHFNDSAEINVQKLIDERLAMHDIVSRVVDKKLMEREAIQQLFMAKIKEQLELKEKENKLAEIIAAPAAVPAPSMAINIPLPEKKPDHSKLMAEALTMSESKKERPLKGFLDKKLKKNEFHFQVMKSEIECPDCKQEIFKSGLFHGCICFGSDMDNKVFVKKSEDGIKIRFPKSWDKDNIEIILDLLRKKNG